MNLGKTLRVHIDTEFTDFINIELISIGLVSSGGAEFYGENANFDDNKSNQWVRANIYPLLDGGPARMNFAQLSAAVWQWFDDLECDFVIPSFDYQSDYDLLIDLLGEAHPKFLAPQNIINNMLLSADVQIVAMGGTDTDYSNLKNAMKAAFQLAFMDYFYESKAPQHHALHDARANRAAYDAVVQKFNVPF